jgi:hypothetical protein
MAAQSGPQASQGTKLRTRGYREAGGVNTSAGWIASVTGEPPKPSDAQQEEDRAGGGPDGCPS